jgi:hypothetical protein
MKYQDNEDCIAVCLGCASFCNHTALWCIDVESHRVEMKKCIELTLECAALCAATAQLISMGSERAKELCRLCAEACDNCASQCNKFNSEELNACTDLCRKCAAVCRSKYEQHQTNWFPGLDEDRIGLN